ncbi:uncharacterized protein LOC115883345 [Sitophilus oryzae]|uniref:Uncharacterized protein LOC115883345 n=1 Tax=Sitophilus oryzae TaxID=7048 RepID=A0A6J2Y1A8_SITOR|nr:uncharacterized protein LOC115883345 [Sitophilus oryzae]
MSQNIFSLCLVLLLGVELVVGSASEEDGPPAPGMLKMLYPKLTKEQAKKCIDETGVSRSDFESSRSGNEPNSKLLCFARCMVLASGTLTKDGEIISDLVKENAPKFLVGNALDDAVTCLEAIQDKIVTCDDMKKVIKCIPKPPRRPE